jgi:hypothetical protein
MACRARAVRAFLQAVRTLDVFVVDPCSTGERRRIVDPVQ